MVHRVLCEDKDHMEFYLNEILVDDGEGIVARHPRSLYINGRTDQVLKLKV